MPCQPSTRPVRPSEPRSLIALYQYQVRYMPVAMMNTAATRSTYFRALRSTSSRLELANANVTVRAVTNNAMPTPYNARLTTPLR